MELKSIMEPRNVHELRAVELANEVSNGITTLVGKLLDGKHTPEDRLTVLRVLVGVTEDLIFDFELDARDLMKQIKQAPDKDKKPLEAHSFNWWCERAKSLQGAFSPIPEDF